MFFMSEESNKPILYALSGSVGRFLPVVGAEVLEQLTQVCFDAEKVVCETFPEVGGGSLVRKLSGVVQYGCSLPNAVLIPGQRCLEGCLYNGFPLAKHLARANVPVLLGVAVDAKFVFDSHGPEVVRVTSVTFNGKRFDIPDKVWFYGEGREDLSSLEKVLPAFIAEHFPQM